MADVCPLEVRQTADRAALSKNVTRKGPLNRRSLGCARDDKGEGSAAMEKRCKKPKLKRKAQFALNLLVAKGFHGVETGSADRGHHSAYQADDHKDHGSYQNSGWGNQQTDIRGFPILRNRTV
jgi:hypothetical protein